MFFICGFCPPVVLSFFKLTVILPVSAWMAYVLLRVGYHDLLLVLCYCIFSGFYQCKLHTLGCFEYKFWWIHCFLPISIYIHIHIYIDIISLYLHITISFFVFHDILKFTVYFSDMYRETSVCSLFIIICKKHHLCFAFGLCVSLKCISCRQQVFQDPSDILFLWLGLSSMYSIQL